MGTRTSGPHKNISRDNWRSDQTPERRHGEIMVMDETTCRNGMEPLLEKTYAILEWELESMFTNSDNYELLEKIRSRIISEPEACRDCATCNNKQNAERYVKRMNACTTRVNRKKRMDDLKEGCPNCRCNGEFKFNEEKCRGYKGYCEQSGCHDFCWWHAKCNCKLIREYDKQKESLINGEQ
jgi:hypothetical protein